MRIVRWFQQLMCCHYFGDYHVRGYIGEEDIGKPHTWVECRNCGKKIVQSLATKPDET